MWTGQGLNLKQSLGHVSLLTVQFVMNTIVCMDRIQQIWTNGFFLVPTYSTQPVFLLLKITLKMIIEKYKKRLTTIGSKCRKTQAVIVLQAFLRAWKARYLFRQSLGSYYSSNSSNDTMLETRREKFYMKELEGLGNKLLRKLSSNTIAVDKVSASIEQTLELSRGIIQSLNDRKTLPSAVDWRIIMKTAFERRHEVEGDQVLPTCAICMSAFEKKKEVCLLSCSHMFCAKCIDALERFTAHHATPSCPVCRMPGYEKLKVLL
jgi:hypothetical protein